MNSTSSLAILAAAAVAIGGISFIAGTLWANRAERPVDGDDDFWEPEAAPFVSSEVETPRPRPAQPNYAALGLGSAEEAEGRN
jgi:hypothetical protein